MKEILIKSYDILKEEQRNADNKAYIFIGLLTAVIGIFGEAPIDGVGENGIETLMQMLLLLLIPLLLLIFSLIPRYSANYFLYSNEKRPEEFNIYYWKTIVKLKNNDEFISTVETRYGIKLSVDEKDLSAQIYANVKIMATKAELHGLAFCILIHMIFFMISVLLYFSFGMSNIILVFTILALIEFVWWVVPFFNNKKTKKE